MGWGQRAGISRAVGPLLLFGGLGLGLSHVSCQGGEGQTPTTENGCVTCHATGEGSIEIAHPWSPLGCVDCHGGDASHLEKDKAHVLPPSGVENVRAMATDRLDELPPEYIRFINPGDLRVADEGCGTQNPNAETGGCHQSIVDSTRLSVMSTFVGHYNVPRYLAGIQGHEAQLGSRDLVDENFDATTAPPGAVGSITALRPPPDDAPRDSVATLMDHYLVKSCPTCHAYSFGLNDSPGNYRSSGCTSCHMIYENDGRSRSGDPTIDKVRPSHPAKHELTTAIPEYQCEHCHFQGARIGLMFQGIREGGFAEVPPNAVPLGEPRHNHGPDFYFVDEDSTNDRDETPGDLHFAAGMTCVDCHVGQDVHGDGRMYSTAKFQVGIRCEDCHGTVRSPIEEGTDGFFYSEGGSRLKQLKRDGEGNIILTAKMTGREHQVKQIKRVLDAGTNPRMIEAMAPDPQTGFSHTDSMECYTCHTGVRQNCFGCHVELDERFTQTDHQTGRSTRGLVQGRRDWYDLTIYLLGTNHRGKISTVCPSQQLFMSRIDENGNRVMSEKVRTTASGKLGFGWQPNHQHTTQRVPQNCDRCHLRPDESNRSDVRETYGFGGGKYFLEDDQGISYDLSRILDDDGEPLVDFAHAGAGAVPRAVIDRVMQLRVEPQERSEVDP